MAVAASAPSKSTCRRRGANGRAAQQCRWRRRQQQRGAAKTVAAAGAEDVPAAWPGTAMVPEGYVKSDKPKVRSRRARHHRAEVAIARREESPKSPHPPPYPLLRDHAFPSLTRPPLPRHAHAIRFPSTPVASPFRSWVARAPSERKRSTSAGSTRTASRWWPLGLARTSTFSWSRSPSSSPSSCQSRTPKSASFARRARDSAVALAPARRRARVDELDSRRRSPTIA